MEDKIRMTGYGRKRIFLDSNKIWYNYSTSCVENVVLLYLFKCQSVTHVSLQSGYRFKPIGQCPIPIFLPSRSPAPPSSLLLLLLLRELDNFEFYIPRQRVILVHNWDLRDTFSIRETIFCIKPMIIFVQIVVNFSRWWWRWCKEFWGRWREEICE